MSIPEIRTKRAKEADQNSFVRIGQDYFVKKKTLEITVRSIAEGRRLALYGSPGAGKTTLLIEIFKHWRHVCALFGIEARKLVTCVVIEQEKETPEEFSRQKEIENLSTYYKETELYTTIRKWLKGDRESLLCIWFAEFGTAPTPQAQSAYKFILDERLIIDGEYFDTRGIAMVADTNYGSSVGYFQMNPLDQAVNDRMNVKIKVEHDEEDLLMIYKEFSRKEGFGIDEQELEKLAAVSSYIKEAQHEGRLVGLPSQNPRSFRQALWYRATFPHHTVMDAVLHTFGGSLGDQATDVESIVTSVFGLESDSFRGFSLV